MNAMNVNIFLEGRVNNDAPSEIRYICALKESSLVGTAMITMADMMLMFSQLANDKFAQMSKKMDVARDTQDMANRLEIIMSKLEKDSDTAEIPADIIQYMREHNILIGDKTIDEIIGDTQSGDYTELKKKLELLRINLAYWEDEANLPPEYQGERAERERAAYRELVAAAEQELAQLSTGEISKSTIEQIKVALESAGGRASDFVQQSQLKLQQLMQNFNTAVTMANSIQSLNAESTKSIAQSIR